MKKNVQRIMATILTVIMMISMLPSNVFAADFDADMFVEPAVEAVSVPAEEQEVESTVEEVPVEADEIAEDISVEDAEAVQGSSEEFEIVDAADPAAADEIEETTEAPVVDDKITLKTEGKDYVVTVMYDASALLPDDVKVVAKEIKDTAKKYDDYCDQALEAVQQENADVDELSYVRLFDIKLVDAAGNVLEPASAVDVQIRFKDVETVEDNTQIVHFAGEEEIPEVIEPTVEDDTVSFATDGFSIYAIIAGDVKLMTVNFYGSDTADPFETMYVKESDLASDVRLAEAVYDPGAGQTGEYSFYGWSIGNADYSVEAPGKTIDDIRTYIKANFSDGAVLNVYAMLVQYYKVEYINDENISLGSESIVVKTAGQAVSYTVNMGYTTDSTHDFTGWLPIEGAGNITAPSGVTSTTPITNGTDITIKGSVKFAVSAPEGHWLIFDENGKHATYNAPRFYKSDEVTSNENMEPMERPGYNFIGWYTGAPSEEGGEPGGSEFSFGGQLETTTTVYAKWQQYTTAPYTVVIWKEGLKANTWDFEDILHIDGNVGQSLSNVVQPTGSGKSRYAVINGTAKRYEGFRYDSYDGDTTVRAEGDSVINVYYVRNTYTLRFVAGEYWPSSQWVYKEIANVKFGYDISSEFPIRTTITNGPLGQWINSFVRWETDDSEQFKKPVVFIDTMPAEDIVFTPTLGITTEKNMYYYVEALPEDTNTVEWNGKHFKLLKTLQARYNYFTEDEDFLVINGYDHYGSDPAFTGTVNGSAAAYGNSISFYYTRQLKSITFKDGSYYDGDDLRMKVGNENPLKIVDEIKYGSDVSSYKEDGANYYDPTLDCPEEGFVFEGWYTDQPCTVPYKFDRMPVDGITVYAKWRQIEYRVFLRPNAGEDPSLTWGSGSQEMNFRVPYGGKISAPEGRRDDFTFYGWYTDAELTTSIYLPGFILNEETVTEDYDKSDPNNYTDPSDNDPWGTHATYNKDAVLNRTWITKKFELYAKWDKKVKGAKGIYVQYDAGEGDTEQHQNNTNAVAAAAPTSPEGKVFEKWVVQKWNEEDQVFEPSGVEVYPGQTFVVNVDNAKIVDENGQHVAPDDVVEGEAYRYIIQVKAKYNDVTTTHITWYKNNGNGGYYRNDTTNADGKLLKINEAVKIYGLAIGESFDAPEGYRFVGWAKDDETVTDPDTGEVTIRTETDKTEADFLEYKDGTFYEPGTTTEVTYVAADELLPYDGLYAIYKPIPFTIYHSATGEKEEIEFSDDFKEGTKFNLTTKLDGIYSGVTPGYLYGGYYRYNEETGEKGTAYTVNGKEMVPEKDTTYYLKEVPDTYLNPRIFITYDTNEGHTPKYALRQLWAIMDLDASCVDGDGNAYGEYGGYGFIIDDDIQIASSKEFICQTLEVNYPDKDKEEYTVKKMFNSGTDEDRLFVRDLTADYLTDTSASAFTLRAYFKTPDGLIVTGKKQRTVHLANRTFAADKATAIQWKEEGGGIWQETDTPGSEVAADTRSLGTSTTIPSVPTYKIKSTPDILTYTVTKVDDGKNESQVVQAGDNTGKITYAGKTGYVFAGWYLDKAYTKAADFSVVTGDMTVYAKYVKATAIGLSFTKKSSKSGSVTLNATLKITGAPDLADAAVSCDYKGKTSTVKFTGAKTTKSGKTTVSTYTGTVAISGLANKSSFKAAISYKTPDGTYVSLADKTCKYTSGKVTVK